jgi:hypothetical protein
MGAIARPWAVERVAALEKLASELDEALAKKDWPALQKHADSAAGQAMALAHGPGVTSLARSMERGKETMLREHFGSVRYALAEAQRAIREHDLERLQTALTDFRKSFEVVREAAKKAPR